MPDNRRNVCSSGWHGVRGTQVLLENHTAGTVTVQVCPSSDNCTFAFSSPTPPFPVPPGDPPTPATLIANPQPGVKYCYCTSGCPGDPKEATNPKTVIID